MNGISTFLWFDGRALEAARYYTSIFPDSRIVDEASFEDARPGREQSVTTVSFELSGRPFTAINGGPMFAFTPAISFVITCADQAEVDHYWKRLCDGGEEGRCGWLVDRFGVSWQVVPAMLFDVLGGPDPEGRARATAAMLEMNRLDVDALQAAYDAN